MEKPQKQLNWMGEPQPTESEQDHCHSFSAVGSLSHCTQFMKTLILQLLTAVTATGFITFAVTHLHQPMIAWSLWFLHWLIAAPIALFTIRYIQPLYRRLLKL